MGGTGNTSASTRDLEQRGQEAVDLRNNINDRVNYFKEELAKAAALKEVRDAATGGHG